MTGRDFHLSEALRARVVRRVLLALSRFGGRVKRVTVRMAEPANPLGGVDQRCRMRAWLQARDDVRAEAINGRIEAAVARAAARLAKRVAWALDGSSDGAHAPLGSWDRVDNHSLARTVPTGPRRRRALSPRRRMRLR